MAPPRLAGPRSTVRPLGLAALLALAACAGKKPAAVPEPRPEVRRPAAAEQFLPPDVRRRIVSGVRLPPAPEEPGAAGSEGSAGPPTDPVSDLDGAERALRTGNPRGAAAFLRTHLRAHPRDRRARRALARALAQAGDVGGARRVLAAALDDPTMLHMAAVLAFEQGRPDEAEALLDRAIREGKGALAARGEKIRIWTKLGRHRSPAARAEMDALYDAYERGETKGPAELLAVAFAALARGTTGAYQDANEVLAEAEAAAPPAQGSWIGERIALVRAEMFLEKYAGDEARATLDLILRRNPWHAAALGLAARERFDAMDFHGAERFARRALAQDPKAPDAAAVLAQLALVEGRRDRARSLARTTALARNPNHDAGRAVVAAAAIFDEGLPPSGAPVPDGAISPYDGTPGFARTLADLLVFLHLYPEADAVLAHHLRRWPDDPALLGAYAASRLRFGDDDTALDLLERAFRRDRFNRRTDNILRLYESTVGPHYTTTKGDGITIRLPKEGAAWVEPHLRRRIAQARAALDAAYGAMEHPLRFEFYDSHEAFSVRTVGVPSLGAAAVCFGRVITAVGPYLGTHDVDTVIWHETAHVYAVRESRGRVPRWFTEGLAEWEAARFEPASTRLDVDLLLEARDAGGLPAMSELEQAFIRARNGREMEVAYALSAHAVRYLVETFGHKEVIGWLRAFRPGAPDRPLPIFDPGIDRRFRAWLDAKLDRMARGFRPDPRGRRPADRTFQAALAAVAKGHAGRARSLLESLVADGYDGYAPRLLLARLALHTGRPAQARRHAEAAAGFRPAAAAPRLLLTEIARRLGDLDAESRHLRKALALEANAFDPAARLLAVALARDDAADLAVAVERARAIAPLHPATLAGLAVTYADRGDARTARAALDRATRTGRLAKGPAATLVACALAARRLGDLPLARRLAGQAAQREDLAPGLRRAITPLTSP